MPLLLVDLDNTLIDRAGAFGRWAREFTEAHGRGPADITWLTDADRDGFESRERLAAAIGERFRPAGPWRELHQVKLWKWAHPPARRAGFR